MHYFVTGATGFIGKRLVKKLLERKAAPFTFCCAKKVPARPQLCATTGAYLPRAPLPCMAI